MSSEDIFQPATGGICIYPSASICHWLKAALRGENSLALLSCPAGVEKNPGEKLQALEEDFFPACMEEVLRGCQWDDNNNICYVIIFCYYLGFWLILN